LLESPIGPGVCLLESRSPISDFRRTLIGNRKNLTNHLLEQKFGSVWVEKASWVRWAGNLPFYRPL